MAIDENTIDRVIAVVTQRVRPEEFAHILDDLMMVNGGQSFNESVAGLKARLQELSNLRAGRGNGQ